MSEENNTATPPAAPASTTAAAATRKKTAAKASPTARRTPTPIGRSDRGDGNAQLLSESRAQNPAANDPFQSGQRIWPD
jgi:hypothetical protein